MKKFFKVGTEIEATGAVYSVRDGKKLTAKGDKFTVCAGRCAGETLYADGDNPFSLVADGTEGWCYSRLPVDYTPYFKEAADQYALDGKRVHVIKDFPGSLCIGHVRRVEGNMLISFILASGMDTVLLYCPSNNTDYRDCVEVLP